MDLISTQVNSTGDLLYYIESVEWILKSLEIEKNIEYYPMTQDEPYADITFKLHIRRRILPFFYNIIIPCVWISLLSLVVFWLPPDAGEKISLGITSIFSFSVFVLLISESIPASTNIPLIVIYLT